MNNLNSINNMGIIKMSKTVSQDEIHLTIDNLKNVQLAILRCYRWDVMNLGLMLSEYRNQGYGSLLLANLYEELKEQKINYIQAKLSAFRPYSNEEYMKFLSKVGFKQTWASYLFGGYVMYMNIPNPVGEKFAADILQKYKIKTEKSYYDGVFGYSKVEIYEKKE